MTRILQTAPVVVLALAACRGGAADTREVDAPRTVRAVAVAEEVVVRPIEATGTLGPKDEITLAFKIGGVIESVRVDEGESVGAGAVLASLDLREIDAAVARARASATDAERDLERTRRLYTDSVVPLAQLEDAEARSEVAAADLEGAQVNRRYAVIQAPADGVILRRRAEAGETVSPGTPVLELGSRKRGTVVRVGLADRDVVRVRIGDRATVQFDAYPDRVFEGEVREIAAAAEAGTGTFAVEIALADATGLSSGLVGRVEIEPRGGTAYSIVPIEALLEADGNGATVFALSPDGSTVERRAVRIAFLNGDRVAVANGLDGVRRVVTDGAAYLQDGEYVRVVQ